MSILGWTSYPSVHFEGFITEITFSFKLHLFVLNLTRGCHLDLLGILGATSFRIESICSFCSTLCHTTKQDISWGLPCSTFGIPTSSSRAEAAGGMELRRTALLQVCRVVGKLIQAHCEQPHCCHSQVIWPSVGVDAPANQWQFIYLPFSHQSFGPWSENRLYLHSSQ